MRERTRVLLVASAIVMALVGLALAGCSSSAPSSSSPSSAPAVVPQTPSTPSVPATPAVTGLALGKMIFTTGNDNAGTIPTKYGMPKIKVNACKNCHGVDAKGGKSKGLLGPDIRGKVLQPDFDEAKFARAVTTGVDDAGKRLHKQMPRFSATSDDTHGLWLYLNSLK